MPDDYRPDADPLRDADAVLQWLRNRRGDYLATGMVAAARWVAAGGPDALAHAFDPGPWPLSLEHPEKAKALRAARAMRAIPGHVWDELGVGFSFNAIAPALAALVNTLEREPKRPRGRPEGPSKFAREALKSLDPMLSALGLETVSGLELAALAVACGFIDGTKGNETLFLSLKANWEHYASEQRPADLDALTEGVRAKLGAEKLSEMRRTFEGSAAHGSAAA